MRMFDVHSHLSTLKGGLMADPMVREMLKARYKTELESKTEDEMYQDFKRANVKVILAPTPGSEKTLDLLKKTDDYLASLVKEHPDVYHSAWALCDPRHGQDGVAELERCIKDLGLLGPLFIAGMSGVPYDDKSYYPFYSLAKEAKVPVLLYVGITGGGAGQPGGGGIRLGYFEPIPYVDNVAAAFPELTIIASHPAWPWDSEMIAVLQHKSNVYNDLHGWSPKYFLPELKREINGRLQDKFVTGCDYPMFTHDRIITDWHSEGYKPEVLEKVLYKNFQKILDLASSP
jgi:predicted TIM-barrel fold metal-dependent hydrolase